MAMATSEPVISSAKTTWKKRGSVEGLKAAAKKLVRIALEPLAVWTTS